MKSKSSFWQRIGLHDWFLKKETPEANTLPSISPDSVYKFIIQKFNESIKELSFSERIVFYHEYIIAFNAEDYKQFMDYRKGIFGLIVQESVKVFYDVLKKYRTQGKTVEPSSSKWVFRFVSHPDYAKGDKGFIGKLLPGTNKREENLRVTFIPRQTGIAQTADISEEILKDFTFYTDGYFEVIYQPDLTYENKHNSATGAVFARLEAILPNKEFAGKKIEYFMKNEEIIISGNDDTGDAYNIFKLPTEWVNSPHLRIKVDKKNGKLFITSFGEKTIMNEKPLSASDIKNPLWTELPVNSKLVLNGIVGINIYKS